MHHEKSEFHLESISLFDVVERICTEVVHPGYQIAGVHHEEVGEGDRLLKCDWTNCATVTRVVTVLFDIRYTGFYQLGMLGVDDRGKAGDPIA